MGVFIHESSYVDDGASVGDGTKIWHFCHVMPGAVIGERCSLGQNVVVMPGTRIGNNVKIQNNVSIYEGVELEDDVFCGPSMVFTNVINPRSAVSRKHEYQRTLVRRGATIGANATVICGVTLGEYAFVGAGAVVTTDVKSFAIVTGVEGNFYRVESFKRQLRQDQPPVRFDEVNAPGGRLDSASSPGTPAKGEAWGPVACERGSCGTGIRRLS